MIVGDVFLFFLGWAGLINSAIVFAENDIFLDMKKAVTRWHRFTVISNYIMMAALVYLAIRYWNVRL